MIDAFSAADASPQVIASLAEEPFLVARHSTLNPESTTVLEGAFEESRNIDVWNLGSATAGTRLTVDVAGSGNDLSLGLFDQDYQVLLINHDRFPRKNLDPYAVFEARDNLESVFLAVTLENKAAKDVPRYTVKVSHHNDVVVPGSKAQHVVLNFLGQARVSIGSAPPVDVDPFDAAVLHPDWSGRSRQIRDLVMDNMVRIYSGLDVHFYFADERPADLDLTWVHFGGEHPSNVGLAANVDYGNRHLSQSAIVYVKNFAKYVKYGYGPEDLARGFANVAAHELGHLLGCNHSDDPADVMNVSPTVDALVAPQFFVPDAGLDPHVFRAGFQDGANVIYSVVGGDWTTVESARRASSAAYMIAVPSSRSLSAHRDAGSHYSRPECRHAARAPRLP
jgi:hypothetical protein